MPKSSYDISRAKTLLESEVVMAKIIVADFDTRNARQIKQIVESRPDQKIEIVNDENLAWAQGVSKSAKDHAIFYAHDLAHAFEIFNREVIDFFFIQTKLIDTDPKQWIEKTLKNVKFEANQKTEFIALTEEEDAKHTRRFMNSGAIDVIHAPIDQSLFLQKFDLIINKKITGEKQVYSMKSDSKIDMAYAYQIEEISEFGVIIKTQSKVELNDYVVFHSEFFGNQTSGEVIARCYSIQPGTQPQDQLAHFVFIGVDAATLQNIRKYLRAEYARKKQAS